MPTKTKVKYATGIKHYEAYDTRSGVVNNTNALWSQNVSGFTTGVELPTWRFLIRRRVNATTAMSYEYRNRQENLKAGYYAKLFSKDASGNWRQWAEYGRKESGPQFQRPPISATFPADSIADTTARLSLLGKIRDAQTQFQAGTFAGELRETIQMLKRPALALRRGVDSYARSAKKAVRRLKDPAHVNRALRETWLETQYGWKPLISDIQSASVALGEAAGSVTKVFLRSGGRAEQNASESINLNVNSIPIVGLFATHREVSVRYKVAVSIWGNGENVGSARWGLDGSNFFPTIWNLIPYSFLVDYFSTIGKVIDAACLQHFVIDWGCKTVRRAASETCLSLKLQPGTIFLSDAEKRYDTGTSMQSFVNEVVQGNRSSVMHVETGFADLRLQIPENPWKWLNIAALANARFIR